LNRYDSTVSLSNTSSK